MYRPFSSSSKTTNIFSLHPSLDTNRQINFNEADLDKITPNEKVTLEQTKEKHVNNMVISREAINLKEPQ